MRPIDSAYDQMCSGEEMEGRYSEPNPLITDAHIATLRAEALSAGDDAQVDLCDAAIAGDAQARDRCTDVIAAAVAMRDDTK